MVGKLIKHELFSTVRVAVIPAAVMILLAVFARIVIATTSESLMIVVLVFYIFAVVATLGIGYFFGIYSFYQSLFTGSGYLTLSLPITADQLIWAKLISAITVIFASIVVCLLSACIFFIGIPVEIIDEVIDTFDFLIYIFVESVENSGLIIFEGLLLGIIRLPMYFLVFYAAMSVGQLSTIKNRKGIAIGLFLGVVFGWNVLNQTALLPLLELTTSVSIHLTLWLKIAFDAGVTVGCYFLVRYIIKNKINLLT